VEDGNAIVDTVTEASIGPLSLDLGSTYYWRIDEVNDAETPTTWIGDIWSFRTFEYLIVEGFEDYNDNEPDRIWDMWADGWDDDNNGSTIGHPDPDFDAGEHFVETTIVYSGDQSGPLFYDNTTANYSEAELEFDSHQNWTSNGAEDVVLHFRGNAVTFQEESGHIAMSGEGADIWGSNDEFRYAYMTLSGNGSMTVRLDSLEELETNTKAGVMIRETLDADSVMTIATMHSNGASALQYRAEAGGSVEQITSGEGDNATVFPVWLKITREGSIISAERSTDGINWEPIDPNTDPSETEVTMSNTVYIGLFVCSHVADTLSAATFYGVETTGDVTGDWTIVAVGDTDQAEGDNTLDKLYMALEDNSGTRHDVFAPVITAVGWGSWYEWIIPQSEFTSAGVDMTRVKKIIVGVGDPSDPMNGTGMIFIDEIGYGRKLVEP
jgi:hypothetical protein